MDVRSLFGRSAPSTSSQGTNVGNELNSESHEQFEQNFPPSLETFGAQNYGKEYDGELALRMVAEDSSECGENLNGHSLRLLLLSLEKKISRNREMRIKHPADPIRFLPSEEELNSEIQKVKVVSSEPHLYKIFVELGGVSSMVSILDHENIDIVLVGLEFFSECTDTDIDVDPQQDLDPGMCLLDAMKTGGFFEMLSRLLKRLDEKNPDEAEGVYHALSVVENSVAIDTSIADFILSLDGFLDWFVSRLKEKLFDSNLLYCSEVLSILLQNSMNWRVEFGKSGGIDLLLTNLSQFRKRDPENQEEFEYMENLFSNLSACLMSNENLNLFLEGEGIELILLLIKSKLISRYSSLKILDYAFTHSSTSALCDRFVDVLGLKTLFSMFLKTPDFAKSFKLSKKKLYWRHSGYSVLEAEGRIISIIYCLFKHLQGTRRLRLFNKFSEDDYQKTLRLLEIRSQYHMQLDQIAQKLHAERESLNFELSAEEQESLVADHYLKLLDAGLYTLQQVDYIIGVCVYENFDSVFSRSVYSYLKDSLSDPFRRIAETLEEFSSRLDDSEAPFKEQLGKICHSLVSYRE
eukprot:Sdes_comp20463_c0_seq1m14707